MPSRESKYVADQFSSFPLPKLGRWYGLTLLTLMLATQGGAALAQEPAKVTLGGLLGNLLGKPAPAVPATGAPAPDSQQDDPAIANYTRLINELAQSQQLPTHEYGTRYLKSRIVEAYTNSSVAGMVALRNVRPNDDAEFERWLKAGGIIFEWRPLVLFTPDGNGFFVRKSHFGETADDWIVYDKNKGGFKNGEAARPYIQQMLTQMDVKRLPQVGTARPTFILYTSPSCPHSAKIDPVLQASGMSYRVFPTYTINPGADYRAAHEIFCAPDPLKRWREELRKASTARRPDTQGFAGFEECSPAVMPSVALADLDMIFGQGHSTPSYYFADGTVISGADKLAQVKAKSKQMAERGLFFQ